MKKSVIMLIVIGLVGLTITGCGNNDENQPNNNEALKADCEETIKETEVAMEKVVEEEEITWDEEFIEETVFEEEDEQQFEPFSYSPENDIRIDYMEDILEDEKLYADMYYKYAMLRIAGGLTDELMIFMDRLDYERGEEALEKFVDNGEKYIVVQMASDDLHGGIEEIAKTMIDSYLKYTRLGEKEAEAGFKLSKEMEEHNPVEKVKKYMEDNKIVVEEIVFSETFEDVNYDIFPMKFTYRYTLKGKVDDKPFEKEVLQNFFIGWDWSEGKDNAYDVIEYVRDVNEEE